MNTARIEIAEFDQKKAKAIDALRASNTFFLVTVTKDQQQYQGFFSAPETEEDRYKPTRMLLNCVADVLLTTKAQIAELREREREEGE